MLRAIGAALIESSQPVQVIEQRLTGIAARYTTERVQVGVLPTILFIQIGTSVHEMDTSVQPSGQLDIAGRVDEIAELAAAGAITPTDAVAAVQAARSARPRFGFALTTVGFGMVIAPSWNAVVPHLFLGVVVGLIFRSSQRVPGLTPILPTVSAVVVTVLATWFVADVAHDGLLRVISPSLVATLPGTALVIGAIELAGGRIVSGASRTVYALAQFGLLLYGVILGVHIAGEVPEGVPSNLMGPWSLYVSMVVIAVGLYLYLSAPKGSLFWLLLTIAIAMLVQKLAGTVLNTAHSGFLAAAVVIPFAILAARIKTAPASGVLVLAAFWSLVPGQLTFMSLSRRASGDYLDTASLNVAAAAIVSIALGTLVGWSLVRAISARPYPRT